MRNYKKKFAVLPDAPEKAHKGNPGNRMTRCLPCAGTGKVVEPDKDGALVRQDCPYCGGTGKVPMK